MGRWKDGWIDGWIDGYMDVGTGRHRGMYPPLFKDSGKVPLSCMDGRTE